MKKKIVLMLVLALTLTASIQSQVWAFCMVENNSDSGDDSLRFKVGLFNNSASCTFDTNKYDTPLYQQAIYFATQRWDDMDGQEGNFWPTHVASIDVGLTLDDFIKLNSPLEFTRNSKLVIGNWTTVTHPELGNYGVIVIDASRYFDPGEQPIKCAEGVAPGSITLRNVYLLTNNVTLDMLPACLNKNAAANNFVVQAGYIEQVCNDGFDNDQNGFTDCNDKDCFESELCKDAPTPVLKETKCDDKKDDDQDKLIDCKDPDCSKNSVCKVTPPVVKENCSKAGDEDNNGLANCDDPACANSPSCPDIVDTFETSCDDVIFDEGTQEYVEFDNDNDGKPNCFDTDCEGASTCKKGGIETNCEDRVDNNADGKTDCDDTNCASKTVCANSENRETNCADTLDDDADGSIDCEDGDCADLPACKEDPETCDNAKDDDGDALIDCKDPNCENETVCLEEAKDLDGDGYCASTVKCESDTLKTGDCDDGNNKVSPAATEICDTFDNNCSGLADETCNGDAKADNDGDGYCEDTTCVDGNIRPGDCDDNDADVNPAAVELCSDGVDNNCDGKDISLEDQDDAGSGISGPACSENLPGFEANSGGCSCDLTGKSEAKNMIPVVILFLAMSSIILFIRQNKRKNQALR